MDAQQILILVLRFVHIFAGVFWAGGVFFMVRFLTPALTDAGPDAGKVMGPMIMKYKLPAVMISLAGTNVLAGLALYYFSSGRFNVAWMQSLTGSALTIGALAGLIAFIISFLVSYRAAKGVEAILIAVGAAGGTPSPEQAAEMQLLQDKLNSGARITAILLVIAIIGMSISEAL